MVGSPLSLLSSACCYGGKDNKRTTTSGSRHSTTKKPRRVALSKPCCHPLAVSPSRRDNDNKFPFRLSPSRKGAGFRWVAFDFPCCRTLVVSPSAPFPERQQADDNKLFRHLGADIRASGGMADFPEANFQPIPRFTDLGGFGKLSAVKFMRHISTFLRRGILVALGGVSLAAVAVEMSEAVVRAYNLAPGETCGPIAFCKCSPCCQRNDCWCKRCWHSISCYSGQT